ncbi:MAG: M15 family metallopeptidase [Clostridia bacterium]|nr:M15 family metallopeptidase [Clostridia bacterium]
MKEGFVDVALFIPGMETEIRYATAHNLTGKPLSGYEAGKAVLTQEAAQALKEAFLQAQSAGYGMRIYDAYRPVRAVADFMRWGEAPEDGRTKTEFYPEYDKRELIPHGYIARRSGHSRGSTVDLTLTENGMPLDMGTGFDFMSEKSHHDTELVTPHQTENRNLLRRFMQEAGFKDYAYEWWHYTLANEPYPDTYFDFVIV